MIKQPRVRSHLRAEAVKGQLFLLGDMEAFVLGVRASSGSSACSTAPVTSSNWSPTWAGRSIR